MTDFPDLPLDGCLYLPDGSLCNSEVLFFIYDVDTDAAYLVLPNARSRYAGHYILSDTPPPPPEIPNPKPNGAILTVCKTIEALQQPN